MAQAQAISCEMERQAKLLPRWDIIKESVANYGCAIVFDELTDACKMADVVAPEHLEVVTAAPRELLPYLHNAGAIFLGQYAPEPLGDYMARPVPRSADLGHCAFLLSAVDRHLPQENERHRVHARCAGRICTGHHCARAERASGRARELHRGALCGGAEEMRTAEIKRKTKETDIELRLTLEGGERRIDTGIGFFDHMLNSFAVHSGFGLTLTCKGDLEVDGHHSVEDCGIALGQALSLCLGDKAGIARFRTGVRADG